jgi:effector-binding domain-containing protein
MTAEPQIKERPAQPYLAIRAPVSAGGFRTVVDRGFPELFGWLGEHDVEPAGPPFIRYLEITRDSEPLEIELGAPVAGDVSGDKRVRADALPAGRWVTYMHVGPYRSETVADLSAARATLLAWVEENGVALDSRETERGTALGGCVEHYITGPPAEPDPSTWRTELAYLAAPD